MVISNYLDLRGEEWNVKDLCDLLKFGVAGFRLFVDMLSLYVVFIDLLYLFSICRNLVILF